MFKKSNDPKDLNGTVCISTKGYFCKLLGAHWCIDDLKDNRQSLKAFHGMWGSELFLFRKTQLSFPRERQREKRAD